MSIANSSDNNTLHSLICKIMQCTIEDCNSTQSSDYCGEDSSDNYSNTSEYSNETVCSYTFDIFQWKGNDYTFKIFFEWQHDCRSLYD